MKLPKLSKPTLKAKKAAGDKPKAARSQIRVPGALEDLYRDMRDRRLFLPALLLIVAIVAVPVALKAPKEDAPSALPFEAPEGAEAVEPAVLSEQPVGIRDYRERLDDLKSKNPFAGSFQEPPVAGEGAGELVEPPSSSQSAPSTPTDTAPVTPAEDVTATPTTDSANTDSGPEILILAPRIDVKAGKFGAPKEIDDVEMGDLLPDRRKAPVVMFIGTSDDLEHASFLVSDDVSDTNGDGSCRPRANDCEFLRLADGEKRTFIYEPTGRKYVVKVTDIREEVVDRRKVEVE